MISQSTSWFPMKNDILYNADISANAKILLAILYRHQHKGVNRKTNKQLGALSSIDPKNIHKYIEELVKHKLIINCCQKGKKGEYGILYKPDFQKGNYTKLGYSFITKFPNDIIIDYFQFINLYRIKRNIKELTATTLVQSNWMTLGDVVQVIERLETYHLVNYNFNVSFPLNDFGIDIEDNCNNEPEDESVISVGNLSQSVPQTSDSEIKKEPAVVYQAGQQEFNKYINNIEHPSEDISVHQEKNNFTIDTSLIDITNQEDDFTDEDWLSLGMN